MLKKIIICLSAAVLFPFNAYAAKTSAQAAVLMNAVTRQILYSDNADKKMAPASTTKIMTALIAIENGDLEDTVTVSKDAEIQEGSSVYLRAGDEITLKDLLYGLMLNSGNDAAVAIAEKIGGTCENFTVMMNERAYEMGCTDTNFENSSGLPGENHYSTAHDMAVIMSYAMENPTFREIVSAKNYTISTLSSETFLKNHNKLLWTYPDCIGGKTGYTRAGGRCLVSCARRDDIPLICVTFDDPNDWSDHISLMDYGFDNTERKKIIKNNDILCTRKIDGEKVNILSCDDFYIPVSGKTKITCRTHLNYRKNIEVGTPLGYAEIYCGGYRVGKIDLKSGQNLSKRKVFSPGNINIFKSLSTR